MKHKPLPRWLASKAPVPPVVPELTRSERVFRLQRELDEINIRREELMTALEEAVLS
jgi:hypothetical protein